MLKKIEGSGVLKSFFSDFQHDNRYFSIISKSKLISA